MLHRPPEGSCGTHHTPDHRIARQRCVSFSRHSDRSLLGHVRDPRVQAVRPRERPHRNRLQRRDQRAARRLERGGDRHRERGRANRRYPLHHHGPDFQSRDARAHSVGARPVGRAQRGLADRCPVVARSRHQHERPLEPDERQPAAADGTARGRQLLPDQRARRRSRHQVRRRLSRQPGRVHRHPRRPGAGALPQRRAGGSRPVPRQQYRVLAQADLRLPAGLLLAWQAHAERRRALRLPG